MDKKSFLEERYCEINKLKNMLQTYPKEYCSTIIKVMESVCEDITNYLNKGKSKKDKKDKKVRSEDKVFTKKQLSEYDGQNRNRRYIAVDGIVYDVTDKETWSGGRHYGVAAGKDLTTYFNTCHKNQRDILNKLEIVGKLED